MFIKRSYKNWFESWNPSNQTNNRYLNAFAALKQPLQVCSVLYIVHKYYFAQSMRYKTELNQLR